MENGEIQNVTVNFNADGDFVISEFLSGYRNEHFPLETSSEIISRHGGIFTYILHFKFWS